MQRLAQIIPIPSQHRELNLAYTLPMQSLAQNLPRKYLEKTLSIQCIAQARPIQCLAQTLPIQSPAPDLIYTVSSTDFKIFSVLIRLYP